jgi:hypothetical protein
MTEFVPAVSKPAEIDNPSSFKFWHQIWKFYFKKQS